MVGEIVFLVTKIPCNSITKRQDQTLNARANYTYKGPARTGRLGAVVTQKTLTTEFDEIGSTRKEVSVSLPASDTAAAKYTNISGMPLSGCAAKSGYGIKVYALDLDGKPEWGCLSVLTVTAPVAVAISFQVALKNAEYVFSGASKWYCYYWDPGTSTWVGDGKWHGLTERIAFSNVKTGGCLAVVLLRDTTTSSQYTSPYFTAVDGGIYQYDLRYGTVSKIG